MAPARLPRRLRRIGQGISHAIDVAEAFQREPGWRMERSHLLAGIDRAKEKEPVTHTRQPGFKARVVLPRGDSLHAAVGRLELRPRTLQFIRPPIREPGSGQIVTT